MSEDEEQLIERERSAKDEKKKQRIKKDRVRKGKKRMLSAVR